MPPPAAGLRSGWSSKGQTVGRVSAAACDSPTANVTDCDGGGRRLLQQTAFSWRARTAVHSAPRPVIQLPLITQLQSHVHEQS